MLNYVILRPVCTGLAFITDIFDKYGEGQINFKKSYVYLATVTSSSQVGDTGGGGGNGKAAK